MGTCVSRGTIVKDGDPNSRQWTIKDVWLYFVSKEVSDNPNTPAEYVRFIDSGGDAWWTLRWDDHPQPCIKAVSFLREEIHLNTVRETDGICTISGTVHNSHLVSDGANYEFSFNRYANSKRYLEYYNCAGSVIVYKNTLEFGRTKDIVLRYGANPPFSPMPENKSPIRVRVDGCTVM